MDNNNTIEQRALREDDGRVVDGGGLSVADGGKPPVADQDGSGGPAATEDGEILRALAEGTIEEKGLLPYSSNYTFLATVHHHKHEVPAVYKPRRGENPLWDFPAGTLCQRETAAFVVSEALGWRLVPPTVLRDGPRGPGSIQFFIECDPDIHYFNMREDARYAPALRRLTLFDYLINNADRKAGHCLYETARIERRERTAYSPLTPRPAHPDTLVGLSPLRPAPTNPWTTVSPIAAPSAGKACPTRWENPGRHRRPVPVPHGPRPPPPVGVGIHGQMHATPSRSG